MESPLPIVALLGLSVTVWLANAILGDPRAGRHDDVLHFALRGIAQLLGMAGVVALFWWSFATLGLLMFGILAVVAWMIYTQSRASRRRALVYLLAAASERGMPLAPAVEALADESGGLLSGRLDHLAAWLRQGVSLPDALANTGRVAPPLLASAAAVGEAAGCLPEAMRQAAVEQAASARRTERVVGRLWYLVFSLGMALSTLNFVGMWIVPKMQIITSDFGVDLSQLDFIGDLLFGNSALIVLAYLSLPMLFVVIVFSLSLLWNPTAPWPLRWALWKLPLRGVLDLLSLAVQRQMPLPSALSVLGDKLPAGRLRWRLWLAAVSISDGGAFEHAMQRQGLFTKAQAGVVHAATRVGNLPWALREIGATVGRRETRRLNQALNLVTALCLAAIIGMVAAAAILAFVPLVALIRSMV